MRELESLEFGDIRVDFRLQTVTRGGQPVALEPKTFDVLRYLVEHRDRLVTKDELLDTVWKDVFVTPNVLTRAIAQLRKGLGDEADAPKFIETVPRRGYRFLADPDMNRVGIRIPEAPAVAVPTPGRRRAMPAALFAVVIGVAVAMGWLGGRSRPAAPAEPMAMERLTSSGDVIDAVISPDGKYLAYVRAAQGLQSLWVKQTQEANPQQLVPPSPFGFWGLKFAPDSNSIYYGVKGAPPSGASEGILFAVPVLPGPPPRRLLTGIDSAVAFSPDGRRIAFYRLEPGQPGSSSLMVADADGDNARALITHHAPDLFVPAFFTAPSWSPDGRRIVASVQNEHALRSRLVLIDAESGVETLLQGDLGQATFTAWAPDGSGVYFTGQTTRSWKSGGPQIWLQPLDGGAPRRVTTDTAEFRNVTVTADSSAIATVGTDHQIAMWRVPEGDGAPLRLPSMRGDGMGGVAELGDRLLFTAFDSGEPQVWSMRADGSDRQQVTNDGWSAWPAASPDGRFVYFISVREGRSGIWRMDAGGSNVRQIAEVWFGSALRVAPDGRTLYFTAQAGGEDSLYRVSADGGEAELVVPGLGWGSLSPDGAQVAGMYRAKPQDSFYLAVFPVAGGAPLRQFAGYYTGGGGDKVHWSSDGRSLLFTTTERANLWRQPLAGGAPVKVTDFAEGAIFGFTPLRAGKALILAKGLSVRDAFLLSGFQD